MNQRTPQRTAHAESDSHTLILHLVHLYFQHNYVRTLPHPFSPVAAQSFVDCYNRLGRPRGRFAVSERRTVPRTVGTDGIGRPRRAE